MIYRLFFSWGANQGQNVWYYYPCEDICPYNVWNNTVHRYTQIILFSPVAFWVYQTIFFFRYLLICLDFVRQIEFGHYSKVNVSALRIMSEPYGTNRERLKAWAGCEIANRCFRRGRFPTQPSDDWARCRQLRVSIWERINVRLHDTYIRARGVCGEVQTDRRGQRETARNRKRLTQTPNNTWCLDIVQTRLHSPPLTSRLARIQTDSSPHYKQKAHLLPATHLASKKI